MVFGLFDVVDHQPLHVESQRNEPMTRFSTTTTNVYLTQQLETHDQTHKDCLSISSTSRADGLQ